MDLIARGNGISGSRGQIQGLTRSILRLIGGVIYILIATSVNGSTMGVGAGYGAFGVTFKGVDIGQGVGGAIRIFYSVLLTLFLTCYLVGGLRMRVMAGQFRVPILLYTRGVTHASRFGIARYGTRTTTRFYGFPSYNGPFLLGLHRGLIPSRNGMNVYPS